MTGSKHDVLADDLRRPHGAAARDDAGDDGTHGGVLTIDVGAVVANYRRLAGVAAGARVAAVVKADAYGLGSGRIAPALHAAGCRTFFVADGNEGRVLRAQLAAHAAHEAAIIVFHGAPPGSEADFAAHRLTPVVNSREQLASWIGHAAGLASRQGCVLQFDTGMSRFGFPLAEADAVRAALAGASLRASLVMSHLACADEPDAPSNRRQLDGLLGLRDRFPGAALSLAASSGIFLGRDFHLDLVRPGAALYGVRPTPAGPPMLPVARLQGRVLQVREVPGGTGVGYGLSARTAGPTRLATVGVGYADGYPRGASNRAAAWWGGRRLPVVGRVSMDSVILDVGAAPPGGIVPGALVDLLCERYGVDDLAADAGTIGYEILTRLGDRTRRRYLAP